MKRAIVLLSAVILIAFSSCKKNYTCTCTGPIYVAPETISKELGKMSKNDAQAKCLDYSYDVNYTSCALD